ncbi:hypothetical protein V7128_13665, partial [Neobacillus vireti]|uniref:hypothetical protein n=1 Tax=Neobacillus vireti TaxID=220686 RepID=UPI002FFDAB22
RRRLLLEYGAGETPLISVCRGGSPARPRKAKPSAAEINILDKLSQDLSIYLNTIFFSTR